MVYTFRPRQKEEEQFTTPRKKEEAGTTFEGDTVPMYTFIPIKRTYRRKKLTQKDIFK